MFDVLLQWDYSLFSWLNGRFTHPVLDLIMTGITLLGDGLVLAALGLPAVYYLKRPHHRRYLTAMVMTALAGGIMVMALKYSIARPRPPVDANLHELVYNPYETLKQYSFPSGHTQLAWGQAVVLSLIWRRARLLWYCLAALVGYSRIYLGVHFPLDVVVGMVIGVLSGYGFTSLYLERADDKSNAHHHSNLQ